MCKIIIQENINNYQEFIGSKEEYGKGDYNLAKQE